MTKSADKPILLRKPRLGLYRCYGCGDAFPAKAPSTACSDKCRQRNHRRRIQGKRPKPPRRRNLPYQGGRHKPPHRKKAAS